jgi:metal-responsive CopG/Arc/MetJ family transcriptional regulator
MLENTQKQNVKSIYLDPKTLELLDTVAEHLAISRSALIRILINQYCKETRDSFGDIEKHIDILTSGRGM